MVSELRHWVADLVGEEAADKLSGENKEKLLKKMMICECLKRNSKVELKKKHIAKLSMDLDLDLCLVLRDHFTMVSWRTLIATNAALNLYETRAISSMLQLCVSRAKMASCP
ncbi:hypothetical protein G195_011275, partial [Phytophthora kernoviae 00238/432]